MRDSPIKIYLIGSPDQIKNFIEKISAQIDPKIPNSKIKYTVEIDSPKGHHYIFDFFDFEGDFCECKNVIFLRSDDYPDQYHGVKSLCDKLKEVYSNFQIGYFREKTSSRNVFTGIKELQSSFKDQFIYSMRDKNAKSVDDEKTTFMKFLLKFASKIYPPDSFRITRCGRAPRRQLKIPPSMGSSCSFDPMNIKDA